MSANPFTFERSAQAGGIAAYIDRCFADARRPATYILVTEWVSKLHVETIGYEFAFYRIDRESQMEIQRDQLSDDDKLILVAMCKLMGVPA